MSKLFLYNKQNKPRIFKNRILKNMNHVKIMFLVDVFKERKITKTQICMIMNTFMASNITQLPDRCQKTITTLLGGSFPPSQSGTGLEADHGCVQSLILRFHRPVMLPIDC